MMNPPKVSVIVPNYNHARFLRQRLDSVLGQSFRDFDLLFLDDASTDNSRAVFQEFAGDPRVRAIFCEENSGSTFKQWNRGVRETRGEYVWFAESDDYADPHLLGELVAQLDANPAAGMALCASQWVDDTGAVRPAEWPNQARWRADFVSRGQEECAEMLFGNTIPNASAVLIRRTIFEQIGHASEEMKLCGDWLLWARILAISDMAYVAKPLNFWRQHGASVRARLMHTPRYVWERYAVAMFILGHCEVPEDTRLACREALLDTWLDCVRENPEAPQWRWRIYRRAKTVDPHLHRRLLHKTVRPRLARMKNRMLGWLNLGPAR